MAQRANYWSCSKFSHWVSTTFGAPPKLRSGTSEEWAAWQKDARHNHPAVYWFSEKFLNAAQNFICWPYDKVCDSRYYLFSRYVSKTHYMKTGLPPGQYHGFEKRLLHGMFNELVDFIEVEKAYHHCMWNDEKRAQYQLPWWRGGWRCFSWGIWRCPEAGLDYLEWESQLKFDDEWLDKADPRYGAPTPQAVAAIEQKRLYDWWKNIRPNRPDPYDISGWSRFCDRRRSAHADKDDDSMLFNDKTDEERAESKRLMEVMDSIEKRCDDEDDDMMVALIKIRQSLWT